MTEIKVILETLQTSTDGWSLIKDIIPSICTIVVVFISSFFVYRSSKKTRNQANAEKLKNDLETFYYPFLILSKRNTQIYQAFRKDPSKPEEFSTLLALLGGDSFKDNDKILLDEIMQNDKKLNKLIQIQSKVIRNLTLAETMSRLSAHYTILGLAYERKITGEKERFEEYVHPSDAIESVEKEIKKIESEIKRLSK